MVVVVVVLVVLVIIKAQCAKDNQVSFIPIRRLYAIVMMPSLEVTINILSKLGFHGIERNGLWRVVKCPCLNLCLVMFNINVISSYLGKIGRQAYLSVYFMGAMQDM